MEFAKIKTVFLEHKTIAIVLGLIVVGGGGYYGYKAAYAKPAEPTRYVTEAAKRDVLIVSIPGSGQVLAEDQVDVKPEASGKITSLLVKEGDSVQAGQVIAEIDRRDALKSVRSASQSVRDAEISLASSRLSLQKLKQPADAGNLLQAQDALNQARRDLEKLMEPAEDTDIRSAEADIASAERDARLSADGKTPQIVRTEYDDMVPVLTSASTLVQNALLDTDAVLGVDNPNQNIAYARVLSALNTGYRVNAEAHYLAAKRDVEAAKTAIQPLAYQNEDATKIDTAVVLIKAALQSMSVVLKDTREALLNTPATITFTQSNIDSLRSGIQTHLNNIDTKQSAVVAQETSIENAKTTYQKSQVTLDKARIALDKLKKGPEARDIASAQEKVQEREQALADLKKGPDAIDLASAQNTVDQRQFSLESARDQLAEAQESLNDYSIRSPFDGVIVKRSARLLDTVSPSTAIVILATHRKIAQISLNEIDISKVKLGQKATLKFDAIDGLTMTGEVVQMDQAGTVSQGVVNYNVKIGFDTSDERVRAAMSVQASIITDTKVNVVVVPNAAVKSSGEQSYVQVMLNTQPGTAPQNKNVEVGIANDSYTEIVSGLNEGENVVTQTIQPSTTVRPATTGAAAGGLRIPGITGGTGAGGFGGGGNANFRAGGAGGR